MPVAPHRRPAQTIGIPSGTVIPEALWIDRSVGCDRDSMTPCTPVTHTYRCRPASTHRFDRRHRPVEVDHADADPEHVHPARRDVHDRPGAPGDGAQPWAWRTGAPPRAWTDPPARNRPPLETEPAPPHGAGTVRVVAGNGPSVAKSGQWVARPLDGATSGTSLCHGQSGDWWPGRRANDGTTRIDLRTHRHRCDLALSGPVRGDRRRLHRARCGVHRAATEGVVGGGHSGRGGPESFVAVRAAGVGRPTPTAMSRTRWRSSDRRPSPRR